MRHALFLPPFGELMTPHAVVEIGVSAESHGWDGLFLWDHMIRPPDDPQEIADPWIVLAAVAAATSRLRIGTMITPLARRRPQKVARETVTLDHLSRGRVTLGVGLGVDSGGELGRFGEVVDERERAGVLDEAMELLLALWSGDEVDHRGPHFTASGVRFLPRPVQRPRIPVWGAAVGTTKRKGPLRRAARLDGLFPVYATPEQIEWMVNVVRQERGSLAGYEVAAGVQPRAGPGELGTLERAGVTWAMWGSGARVAATEVRALAGKRPAS
ncbi:MAG: LLM class flavin-dependent oxidoreductase [Acidimicrobiales bacterium]